jgi:hypothetical protein
MRSYDPLSVGILGLISALLALVVACKDAKQASDTARVTAAAGYSFQSHLSRGNQTFDLFTEGNGSLRTLTIVRTEDGTADTTRNEIEGAVMNAECADLDRDSIPELYVFVQSAGSGSYAHLFGYRCERREMRTFTLPELDKRLAAGYLGHDTLWVQDSVLVRRFPVYTESDFNASASGGTRTLEYALQRDRSGAPSLQCVHIINNQ